VLRLFYSVHTYRVRPRKHRKPYLRYLWLDVNKTKTGINHFKSTISTTLTIFFSKSNSRSDDNQLCFFKKLGIFFIPILKEIIFNDMPHNSYRENK
jgi:hypothetical protein